MNKMVHPASVNLHMARRLFSIPGSIYARVEPFGWERCMGMCVWVDCVDGAPGHR